MNGRHARRRTLARVMTATGPRRCRPAMRGARRPPPRSMTTDRPQPNVPRLVGPLNDRRSPTIEGSGRGRTRVPDSEQRRRCMSIEVSVFDPRPVPSRRQKARPGTCRMVGGPWQAGRALGHCAAPARGGTTRCRSSFDMLAADMLAAVMSRVAGAAAVGYLLGSFPTADLVSRTQDVDLRTVGDRNPGWWNAASTRRRARCRCWSATSPRVASPRPSARPAPARSVVDAVRLRRRSDGRARVPSSPEFRKGPSQRWAAWPRSPRHDRSASRWAPAPPRTPRHIRSSGRSSSGMFVPVRPARRRGFRRTAATGVDELRRAALRYAVSSMRPPNVGANPQADEAQPALVEAWRNSHPQLWRHPRAATRPTPTPRLRASAATITSSR